MKAISKDLLKNGLFERLSLLISLIIGLSVVLLAAFFPSFLLAFSSISVFGSTPFMFLAAQIPIVAAFTCGLISMIGSMAFLGLFKMIGMELGSIMDHVLPLFHTPDPDLAVTSSPYVNTHLKSEVPVIMVFEDDFEEDSYDDKLSDTCRYEHSPGSDEYLEEEFGYKM